jgi:hypothetical protein
LLREQRPTAYARKRNVRGKIPGRLDLDSFSFVAG